MVEVKCGDSMLFWYDAWDLGGSSEPLRNHFPHLFSFVTDDKLSVKEVIRMEDHTTLLHLPISTQAHAELMALGAMLQNFVTDPMDVDIWK